VDELEKNMEGETGLFDFALDNSMSAVNGYY
jgi:hypothetical protein